MIAGLGNPGRRYARTRHNLGYWVVDELANLAGIASWGEQSAMAAAVGRIGDEPVVLVKPRRWMNNSGGPIVTALHQWPVGTERLVVICDDVALPDGRVRIRHGGSAGGHRGLSSVIAALGTDLFFRVRIGVGSARTPDEDLSEFVLRPMTEVEAGMFEAAAARAARMLEAGIAIGSLVSSTVDTFPTGVDGGT